MFYKEIVNIICFELDNQQVHHNDVEYLFTLAYYQIRMVTDLLINHSNTKTQIMQDLFTPQNPELADISKLNQLMNANEDVQNLINLFMNQPIQQSGKININNLVDGMPIKEQMVFSNANGLIKKLAAASGGMLNNMMLQKNNQMNNLNDTDSLAQYSQADLQLDSKRNTEKDPLNTNRPLTGQNKGQDLRQSSPMRQINEFTTLDLMYSFDPQKTSFQEDTEEGNINQLMNHLHTIFMNHIDFYGSRQLQIIMKSLFAENRIEISNYSIIDGAKELVKVNNQHLQNSMQHPGLSPQNSAIHNQNEEILEKTMSEMNVSPSLQGTQQFSNIGSNAGNLHLQQVQDNADLSQMSIQYKTVETVNPSKVNMQMRAIFKEFNSQHKSEMRFTLNNCFYKIIYGMMNQEQKIGDNRISIDRNQKVRKITLEMKKFQKLGEIGGLSFVLYEMLDTDKKLTSDKLFRYAYECYDKLYNYGSRKEFLVKFLNLKNAKKMTVHWQNFWNGVIIKSRQALQLEYFKDALENATVFQQELNMRMRDINEDYNNAKKIILDYNYQLGKISAMYFVIEVSIRNILKTQQQKYKQDKDKIEDDIKYRVKVLRDSMEKLDVRIISMLMDKVQQKRNNALYFRTLGEHSLSKCATKGIDSQCVIEYMMIQLFLMRTWQIFISQLSLDKVSDPSVPAAQSQQQQPQVNNDSQIPSQEAELEKLMLSLMKFQKVKEIDEKLMAEIKEDGVLGFDKFRAYTQRMAEEEEKQTNLFKAQNTSYSQQLNVNSPNSTMPILEKKGTFKLQGSIINIPNPQQQQLQQQTSQNGGSSGMNQKQKASQKFQVFNFDTMDTIIQILEQEYALGGKQSRISQFQSFINGAYKDLTYELNNEQISTKYDLEKQFKIQNDFIELDLTAYKEEDNQKHNNKQIFKMIGQHFYVNRLKQDLLTPYYQPQLNEKKSLAHNLLEHFLKSLGTMKSTRYHKQFKETRIEALQQFVTALKSINKLGKWNNFDMSQIGGVQASDLTVDQCFSCINSLEQFLKEKERETMWRDLVQIKDPQIRFENGGVLQSISQMQSEEMENSQEYKTFNQLFHLMKGTARIKTKNKERIFRPFLRILDQITTETQKQKVILNMIMTPESNNLQSQDTLETFITEQIFAVGEDEDFVQLMDVFTKDKQLLFERRKNRGLENYVLGAVQYLNVFNEGEEKSELIIRLHREIQKIHEQFTLENKGVRLQAVQSQFRESSEKLLKKVVKQEYLAVLMNKSKKIGRIEGVQIYLKNQLADKERLLSRIEKLYQYLKSNNVDDQDDNMQQQLGAREINNILSGQNFLDDVNFNNQKKQEEYGLSEEQQIQHKLIHFTTQFTKRMASADERISSKQIIRNDFVFGYLQIVKQRITHLRDKFRLREQYDEGLKHLINIFEIYKTPITHYQKSYERVCRFISKELLYRIIESDEGYLKFLFFEMISKKGSAIFKNAHNKLEVAFAKLEIDEQSRIEVEKVKLQAKRELDTQTRIFKEFIDLEENNKVAMVKQQQIEHQNFRLMQELAALLLLIRVFYIKLEQDENAYPLAISNGLEKTNLSLS
ncbi:UNKNOWN [Stylonychia lemnae]|uniref:Uncharacterized protein n=1 Tax=Stylonychia lemnae TaxID=5949 RepID=A0A077ZQG8_STYLE|nr:UNKNOWN [Stylonychia lemnae]|eukprot:CDW72147.1 UNKNOWN [Stylonychia lemnae]